ncbi:hypothetical protein LEN26_002958 [Aphanomyces euteiches]|nr:hypothetical protein LEN26_002958 [Aphanomyces euteiches]KAH9182929.1 hypothetical protein AeNC1_015095 [Aphanomyces euteiches]
MLKANGDINLDVFTYQDFLAFIGWSYQFTNNKPGTLTSYRSAIKDLYKRENRALPPQFDDDMKNIFQGMRRHHAEQTQSGGVKESGKRPLGYSLYQRLCVDTLSLFDGGFSHLFLTLSWNLMCRSISTQQVQFEHISFQEDSISVVYIVSKTDQAGEKQRDPRHIYANSFDPSTCVFLAFGLYFACHPQLSPGDLFPQRDRFGKILSRLLNSNDFGTHSIRKGVATFACSGTTSGPSIASVCLRCGWTLGHVLERYIHYERAGDQYLGRIVAGLPNNKPEFAALPPHFTPNGSEVVCSVIDIVFPALSSQTRLHEVLSYGLASLIYHFDWLCDSLPPKHPFFSCPFFTNNYLLHGLKPYLSIERNYTAIVRIADDVSTRMQNLLEDQSANAGNISRDFMQNALSELASSLDQRSPSQLPATDTAEPTTVGRLFTWDGRLSKLPKEFELPNVDAASAWRLWWLGNMRLNIPPYRYIVPLDLSSRKQRKLLSDWKFSMTRFEKVCELAGFSMPQTPSEEIITHSFQFISAYIVRVCSATPRKRTRRVSQFRLVSLIPALEGPIFHCIQKFSIGQENINIVQ